MPKTKPRQGVEFLIPLATRRAATEDEGGGDWVKVLPIGSWASHHFWPTEGIYEITAENLAAMEANFRADIPPIKIAVNQNHSRGPSVGWIEDLKAEADGLRARVKWTPLGDELLTQDAFRYVSAEWYDSATPYIEKTSGRKIAWVFEGLAVTNNPFFVELPGLQPAAAEEDGTLVYTGPAAAPDKGEDAMPKLQDAPPQPKEGSDPGRTPEDVEALRAERDRLAADKAVLEAQAAERKAAEQLEKLTARFAAVKTKDGQLAEAHAKRLATVAIEVPEDKREEHVTATIEALSTGIVPAGEIGGMGAQITSDGISPALVATARRLGSTRPSSTPPPTAAPEALSISKEPALASAGSPRWPPASRCPAFRIRRRCSSSRGSSSPATRAPRPSRLSSPIGSPPTSAPLTTARSARRPA